MTQLIERLSSPISGTFFASFMLWNWPLFFLFFDSKLNFAEKVSIVSHMSNPWTFFVLPFLSGAIYLFGMPWLLTKLKIFQDKIDRANELQTIKSNAIKENEKIFGNMFPLEINYASINSLTNILASLETLQVQINHILESNRNNHYVKPIIQPLESTIKTVLDSTRKEIESSKELHLHYRNKASIKSYSLASLLNIAKSSKENIEKIKKGKSFRLD